MTTTMMQQPQARLLACYEAIRNTSEQMVEAARASDWTTLCEGERMCAQLIESVNAIGNPLTILDTEGRRQRMAILRSVLAADARIRDLRDPWLRDVERYVGRGGRYAHSDG
jgi:flagellar protein FliT